MNTITHFIKLYPWRLVFFAFVVIFLLYVHTRGFIPYDDGWFLFAASRMIHGEIPYKDFQYLYNPGSLYINAFAFLLFGENIFSSRIMAFFFSLATVATFYFLGKRLSMPFWITALVICNYLFWGPSHINFIWPVMVTILTGLVNNYLFFRGTQSKDLRYRTKVLFFTGVIAALTLILKQNFGLALFLNNILVFAFLKEYRNLASVRIYLVGYLLVWLVQILYFFFTNSLVIYINDMIYFMFDKILKHGMLASPYPWEYSASYLYIIIKILFYLSPFLIALGALILSIRRRSKLFYFATFCLSYYALSIRPTTDYVHLAPLLSMTSISFVVLFALLKEKRNKIMLTVFVSILAAVGLYSSFFSNYYRWHAPMIHDTTFLNNPKAQIWTSSKEAVVANQVVSYIEEKTKKNDYIFIYSLSPMFYFLTDTRNPTRYDYFHPAIQTDQDVDETIQILQKRKVKLIVSDTKLSPKQSKVEAYILKNFRLTKQIDKYYFFSR